MGYNIVILLILVFTSADT